jgi:hypothetical protein
LILPLAVPLLAVRLDDGVLVSLLFAALAVGGIAYAPFSILMFIWIGRIKTLGRTQLLSFLAPLLFLPFLLLSMVGLSFLQGGPFPTDLDLAKSLGVFALYGLFVGYIYVGITNAVALLLELSGWLKEEHPNKPLEPTR